MENKDVCRLCLKSEAVAAFPLDEYRITKLKSTIPELNVELEGSACSICVKCKEVLDEFFTLKKTISDNEDLIRSRKAKLNVKDKVKLDQIFSENGSESSEGNICRTCLNSNKDDNLLIDNLSPDDPFQDVLKTCLSNLDRGQITDSVICLKCVKKLFNMYSFVSSCLRVEDKIKQFRESDGVNKNLDIAEVLLKLKEDPEKEEGDNDFLSAFEVQDEEEMDIFDSISYDNIATNSAEVTKPSNSAQWNSDYDTTRKRGLEMSNELVPQKRPKHILQDAEELSTEELPHFKFNFNLMHNMATGISLPDWLAIVDMQKEKFGWSDNKTIQKVLLRLQSIPQLHTWFSSIGDIMTWDEWKNKLIQAFPDSDDYYLSLKRTILRKKKVEETFVEYCKAKIALLETMNITGKNAVSCIINGLSWVDVLVYCLARIGNYNSPEELLDYFKVCDEKEAVLNKGDKKAFPFTPPKQREIKTTKAVRPASTKGLTSEEFKKLKGKCFICLKPGHMAAECWSTLPAQTPPNKPKQLTASVNRPKVQQNKPQANYSGEKKKQPSPLCEYCGKYGHSTRVCSYAKLAGLKRAQRDAKTSQTTPPRCTHCGGSNHSSVQCRKAKKVDYRALAAKEPGGIIQCNYCRRYGHTSDDCYIANRKADKNFEKHIKKVEKHPLSARGNPYGNDSQEKACSYCGSSKHLSYHCGKHRPQKRTLVKPERRDPCQYCGSQSHLSNACYSQHGDHGKVGHEEENYLQLMCFKCYKVGHKAEDCTTFSDRNYMH